MKVTRLRLHGFKSFVESADIPIESGLTGIVGPNGCGKSNLVEALRFVMGESSYKALRGGGMDDVIFAGSSGRPARNIAEVTLLAEAEGAAGGAEQLEITRRIERDAGSVYRVNGREARARDVQLLFADAASGPRSSALVRQGQIGELIAARPVQRRSLLEDAAGISGLHSRRGEAEGKLKAAEANIERLDDVMNEVAVQLEALRRQARQAVRYRTLSLDIRKAEALLHVLQWEGATARQRAAEAELQRATAALADAGAAQAASARDEAIAAAALPDLRDRSAAAGAALQRLRLLAEEIERDEQRLKSRREELAARRSQTAADLAREGDLGKDAAEALGAVEAEAARLAQDSADHGGRLQAARQASEDAATLSVRSEAAFAEASAALAAAAAERAARERAAREADTRLARVVAERAAVLTERETLAASLGQHDALETGRTRLAEAERRCAAGDAGADTAEAALLSAREAETRSRLPLDTAGKALAGLEVEAQTLARVLDPGRGRTFPPVMDLLEVAVGYEQALVAALGDDLEASLDAEAPASWGRSGSPDHDPSLPRGAEPLTQHVRGPDTLLRRLRQIGVVADAAGDALVAELAAGQRLVSRTGALWRWDGLRVRAGASTVAARALEQRNRAAALVGETAAARAAVAAARGLFDTRRAARIDAERSEKECREAARQARRDLDAARAMLAEAERHAARAGDRVAALAGALERLDSAEAAAAAELAAARKAMASLPDTSTLAGKREALQSRLEKDRAAAAAARLAWERAGHEEALRGRRLGELAVEAESWRSRTGQARARITELRDRVVALDGEIAAAAAEPEQFAARRRALVAETAEAGAAASAAADNFAAAETAHRLAAVQAREALEALSKARADHARDSERVLAASGRRDDLERQIRDAYNRPPHALRGLAEVAAEALLPEAGLLENKLERLKGERERLGAVNLRAEDEANELDERAGTMRSEREDLEGAIRQLRHVIGTLNREGRERLLAAFHEVDGHFRALFQHLFGGGTAELALTDSEDALEAGLEIIARPPGKRPQIMTLLSGGEQALTAMALIFAVFLTNPSPICVLDEVDAPLDDANVERFCGLLDEMRRRTETRFFVVTHNPITMARMDRLFGVTMAEKGISQLVTVDLQSAEELRQAS